MENVGRLVRSSCRVDNLCMNFDLQNWTFCVHDLKNSADNEAEVECQLECWWPPCTTKWHGAALSWAKISSRQKIL